MSGRYHFVSVQRRHVREVPQAVIVTIGQSGHFALHRQKGTVTMNQHIGIVGCSAEGAALCYRTICVEGSVLLGPHAHPEVSMHTPSLSDYVACLDHGDLTGVGDLIGLAKFSALHFPDLQMSGSYHFISWRRRHVREVPKETREAAGTDLEHLPDGLG